MKQEIISSKDTKKSDSTAKKPPEKKKDDKPKHAVLGWVEHVVVSGTDMKTKAKLDSGAKTSSVNAEIIKTFKRDDKKFVLFRITLDDDTEDTLEREIVRWVKIKTKKGGTIRRPVVIMSLCLDGTTIKGEVNLAERGHFLYPLLIGRNMLKDRVLIDPSKTFVSKPACKK